MFNKFSNILKDLHIKHPIKTCFQLLKEDDRTLYNFFDKNRNKIMKGGKKKIYKYGDREFIFYISKNEDITNISIHRISDKNQDCLLILISDREAIIHNISYYPDCINTGLEYPGGGTILLKTALQFLRDNKKKYNIKKILLKDNSSLWCEEAKEKINLSSLYMLIWGETWYGKYGFKPYDTNSNKEDEDMIAKYRINQHIVEKTYIKETNIKKILEQTIKKYNLEKYVSLKKMMDICDKYMEKTIMTFFRHLMDSRLYKNTCVLFFYSYKKIMDSLKMYNLHGISYYLII